MRYALLFKNDILIARYVIFAFTLLIVGTAQAQLTNIPLNQSFRDFFATPLVHQQHSAVQPYNPFAARMIVDSIQNSYAIENGFTQTWLGRKLLNENMANVKGEDYQFIFNPLFDLRLGRSDDQDRLLFLNTRGVQVGARLGDNILIYSDFYENLSRYPDYIDRFIRQTQVVPGRGVAKRGQNSDDYAYVTGHIDYQANKFINFRFGNGKNFIGDGYRSLLLSDNSFNYPFLRMMTSFWKIQYTNLFTQMNDINTVDPNTGAYGRKYVTAHHLSAALGKKWTLSLYETVIYQDTAGTRGYELAYLNPFILYRPIEFALGSRGGNVIIGGGLKYQVNNNTYLYGQGLLDELLFEEFFSGEGWWATKFALQAGFKTFPNKLPGLMVQSEVNAVRPYTYGHTTPTQNYAHYNQALAHPLGGNFVESASILRYLKNRYFFEGILTYAIQGRDFEDTHWGSDLYISSNDREQNQGNRWLQGNRTTTFTSQLTLGYIVNPNTNWRLQASYLYRSISPEVETSTLINDQTHYFQFGIVTAIGNQYLDF
jgi:hypothetical protein